MLSSILLGTTTSLLLLLGTTTTITRYYYVGAMFVFSFLGIAAPFISQGLGRGRTGHTTG